MSPPYVPTEPGALDEQPESATESLIKAQRRRMDEAALTAEDLRIARLVHGLVKAEIEPHVKRLEKVVLASGVGPDRLKWLDLAIAREGRREEFHRKIMQHTTMGLVWLFIAGAAAMLWEGFKLAVRMKGGDV